MARNAHVVKNADVARNTDMVRNAVVAEKCTFLYHSVRARRFA